MFLVIIHETILTVLYNCFRSSICGPYHNQGIIVPTFVVPIG